MFTSNLCFQKKSSVNEIPKDKSSCSLNVICGNRGEDGGCEMVSSGPQALSAGSCTPGAKQISLAPAGLRVPVCRLSHSNQFFLLKTNDGGQHIDGSARAA